MENTIKFSDLKFETVKNSHYCDPRDKFIQRARVTFNNGYEAVIIKQLWGAPQKYRNTWNCVFFKKTPDGNHTGDFSWPNEITENDLNNLTPDGVTAALEKIQKLPEKLDGNWVLSDRGKWSCWRD